MSEPKASKKIPRWTIALWLLPMAALAIYALISNSGKASTPSNANSEAGFDPSGVPELQIKGSAPDGASSWTALDVPTAPARDPQVFAHGKDLYAKACAACHGDDGKGEGLLVAKWDMLPRPANFTIPIRSIKLRSTRAGTLPLDEDLFRSITRGLPGTAMLSFHALPEADRWALVHFVKEFWSGDKRWQASQPCEIPKKLANSAELIETGRREYTKWCQNCHGPEGIGGTSVAMQVERTYPAVRFARAHGKFLLRGASEDDLALTLLAGSSGASPMMSFIPTFFDDQPADVGSRRLWGTVYYTRALIDAQK